MELERSRRGLKLRFGPRRDPSPQSRVMAVQSSGSPAGIISGLHFGSPGNLCHLDVGAAERRRVYYMGDGGGIPQVRVVVSLVVRSARGLSQHQRVSRKVN